MTTSTKTKSSKATTSSALVAVNPQPVFKLEVSSKIMPIKPTGKTLSVFAKGHLITSLLADIFEYGNTVNIMQDFLYNEVSYNVDDMKHFITNVISHFKDTQTPSIAGSVISDFSISTSTLDKSRVIITLAIVLQ